MTDPRPYTCEELEALPIGTILVVHDEPMNTVWRVFLPNRVEMLSHSGIPVRYLTDFAVDSVDKGTGNLSPDLSIIGIQKSDYHPYQGDNKNE